MDSILLLIVFEDMLSALLQATCSRFHSLVLLSEMSQGMNSSNLRVRPRLFGPEGLPNQTKDESKMRLSLSCFSFKRAEPVYSTVFQTFRLF